MHGILVTMWFTACTTWTLRKVDCLAPKKIKYASGLLYIKPNFWTTGNEPNLADPCTK